MRRRLPLGDTLQGLQILDKDPAVPELHATLRTQPTESSGNGLPVGPDHGGQVLVGVAGRYLVALRGHQPLALDEPQDLARQPARDLLEGEVGEPPFGLYQALAQQACDPHTQRRIPADELLESLPPHAADDRRFQGLYAQARRTAGGEARRPDERPAFDQRDRHLLPRGPLLADPRPPLQQEEQPLFVLLGRNQDGVTRVEPGEGGASRERPHLLPRRRRQDVYHREQALPLPGKRVVPYSASFYDAHGMCATSGIVESLIMALPPFGISKC